MQLQIQILFGDTANFSDLKLCYFNHICCRITQTERLCVFARPRAFISRSVADHVTVSAVDLCTECGKLCDKCSSELKEPSGTAMYVVKGPQGDVTCLCWPEATIPLLCHRFNTLLQMQRASICSNKCVII